MRIVVKTMRASVIIIPFSNTDFYISLLKEGKYGLIGGKCEPFESSIKGAIRELKEETGISATSKNLIYLGTKKETNCKTRLYLLNQKVDDIVLQHNTPEGTLCLVDRKKLTGRKSRFPSWNKWAFAQLDFFRKVGKND